MPFRTLFIDLDETVYPAACGVWEAIAARMDQYIYEQLAIPREEIVSLRQSLFHQYGTTLRGLQETRGVDMVKFLDFVHDVPVADLLQPDPELRTVLMGYPQRKVIFTNADRGHAARVIAQLGLEGCFDLVIDIYDLAPNCKPMREAYQTAMRLTGETDPAQCVFIDDSPRNLSGARAAGMFTVQVGSPKAGFQHPDGVAHARIARLHDLPQVLPPA